MAIWPGVLLDAGQDPNDSKISGFVSCSQIEQYRDFVKNKNISLFTNLIITTRDREATNPIDYIYGIAGMITEEHRNLMNTDYSLSYCQGVIAFCSNFIQVQTSLALLGMASSERRNAGLPSWCPDFSTPSSGNSPLYVFLGFKAGFKAHTERASNIKPVEEENGSTAISVPGFRVDIVTKVAEKVYEPQADNTAMEAAECLKWLDECEGIFEGSQRDQHDPVWETYYRTLIAGHFASNQPVPSEKLLHKIYTACRKYLAEIASSAKSEFESSAEKDAVLQFDVALSLQKLRKFFKSENGRIGLGPSRLQVGDVVCVFYSGACLWALRFDEKGEKASLIGDAFMDGFMDLNGMPATARGKDEEFVIV